MFFTLSKGIVGSLELAQYVKVVKNFEKKKKKKNLKALRENCPITEKCPISKFINKLFSNLSTV